MSMITLPVSVIARIKDLFKLYSTKSAFILEEYADVGGVYSSLVEALKSDGSAELSETYCKYVLGAINVCSQRIPVDVQNYRAISELLEIITSALKDNVVVVDEETKTEL